MAKVFTIIEGLENLGALKSGGQGSVYKARRTGQIITAIKILPTPIYSESEEDKNFTSFQNEVQKLKKVNETANPNVVSILASGITSSGNLPYIEMEYIEGPDLAELLKPPHDPIFSIKEIIKVADHLSNALAHCHRADVKHGDIKSNNVKFNQRTGNYMLLDFGLSVMSDEQRRTSLRHAGAIEFMAPEQNAGEMLFESDIYSFGIILFELLSGTVPFPLLNKGEMARNAVMVAHMETTLPEPLSLRRRALPNTWSYDKQEREMQVPGWLTSMIYKCLEKEPFMRFRNGTELLEFIHSGIIKEETNKVMNVAAMQMPLTSMEEQKWKDQVEKMEIQVLEKDRLLTDLQEQIERKDQALYQFQYVEEYKQSKQKGISKELFSFVLIIALGLAAFTVYSYIIEPYLESQKESPVQVDQKINDTIDSSFINKNRPVKKLKPKIKKTGTTTINNEIMETGGKEGYYDTAAATPVRDVKHTWKYKVISTAYFYDIPDENTRRNAYLTANEEITTTLQEKNNFIFVEFKNNSGKITRGWLLKKNLALMYDY